MSEQLRWRRRKDHYDHRTAFNLRVQFDIDVIDVLVEAMQQWCDRVTKAEGERDRYRAALEQIQELTHHATSLLGLRIDAHELAADALQRRGPSSDN